MGILTSGKVTYGRTVQPAQYESKKAEAEINFTALEDGSDFDIMFAKAASVAILKVHEMVGISKPAAAPAAQKPAETPAAPKAAERSKADIEKEHLASLEPKPAAPRVPRAAKKAEEPKPQITTNPEDRKQPEAEEDFDDFNEPEAPAVTITDADLTAACTKANGVIKDGIAIRGLASECGATTGVSSIPAARRQEFLDKLEVMKKSKAS